MNKENIRSQLKECLWTDARTDKSYSSPDEKIVVQFDFLERKSFVLKVPQSVALDMHFRDCSKQVEDFVEQNGKSFSSFMSSDTDPLFEVTLHDGGWVYEVKE